MSDRFLAAIDPGGHTKGCSLALYRNRVLERVSGSVTFRTLSGAHAHRVVVERPQQDERSRAVPPAIMIDMTAEGFLLAGMFVGSGAELVMLTPDQWKGGVREDGKFIGGITKATHHANMIETGVFSTAELAVIGQEFGLTWHEVGGLVLLARRKEALARGGKHRNGHYSEAREVARLPDVLDAAGIGAFDLGRTCKDGKRK